MSDGLALTPEHSREARRFVMRLSLLTALASLIGGVIALGGAVSLAALVWFLA